MAIPNFADFYSRFLDTVFSNECITMTTEQWDTLYKQIDALEKENVKMERALRNCTLLAMRERRHGNAVKWDQIIRFVEEGGVPLSILREKHYDTGD